MASDSNFDVIIIGSGAGGCAAAFTLVRAGLRVALIEKGGELPRDGSTLDVDTVVKRSAFMSQETWLDGHGKHFAPQEHFNVGGKTKWYGAALLRYSAAEFLADPAHQCPGWPISQQELEPYYDTATKQLDIRVFDCEPDLARIAARLTTAPSKWHVQPMPMGLSAGILSNAWEAGHFDGFASVAGLKSEAENAFLAHVRGAPNLSLFSGHAVVDLLPGAAGAALVQGVRLDDGRTLQAHNVVLAAGALHSPRLLQRYAATHQLKLATPTPGALGRNLKMHVLTAMVAVSLSVKTDLIRKTRLFLHDDLPHSSVQPLGFDGDLIATLIPRWVPGPLARFIGRRSYGFFLQTEDGSHIDNRIIAAGTETAADRELPTMDYDQKRLRPALDEHLALIRRLRTSLLCAGMIAFSQRVGLAGTAHVNGTMMAGDDPQSSVVDSEGKVHGLESLYVVDGSVLPRSSRVNPSLTIFAWSLRTASRLAERMAARRP